MKIGGPTFLEITFPSACIEEVSYNHLKSHLNQQLNEDRHNKKASSARLIIHPQLCICIK